ncbi:MAG TPA: N-acetyltransferase [Steroidobacteraceae bacterium]|nr:N-acetyltransferase [Steroidobacteraceae bacterium]
MEQGSAMPIVIRPGTPADLDFVVDCNARLARETEDKQLDPAKLRPGVESVLATPAKGRYFIAELDRRPAGQIMFTTEWSDWRNGFFWWIQSVYVMPQARRSGVFTALFRHLERLAREDPTVCGLRLYVDQANEAAQRTYRRLGLDATHYTLMEVEFRRPATGQGIADAQAR